MRASFSSRDADNHTAYLRIKTNASSEDEFIILPVRWRSPKVSAVLRLSVTHKAEADFIL
uniref:Uncharacterized protein n=1 Tax=Anguilla anguilla TaxID=7936 RepID=A0A0E9QSQ1_ANGAN